jgi:hypothetical protein
MTFPQDAHTNWAIGCMFESRPQASDTLGRLSVWLAEPGTGTPLLWFRDERFIWAYLGTQDPFARSQDILSPRWLERLFTQPGLARELSGVFALFAEDLRDNTFVAVNDRLGVQAIHYAREESGTWRVSTHLMWLMLAMGHDGTVNDEGFLAHMGFGYTTDAETTVYRGISKLAPAGCLRLSDERARQETYWSPPTPAGAMTGAEIPDLAADLRDAMETTLAREGAVLGLTAGKDSLCLASVLDADESVLAGTFGMPDCADQVQAGQLSTELGVRRIAGTVCAAADFPSWMTHIAFQSAGLTTASYVDMAAFVGTHLPPGWMFIMGEGGECVRDFFNGGNSRPLETLTQTYMTAPEHIQATLASRYDAELQDYPRNLLARAQTAAGQPDDETFALHFYRHQRMPGNFSLRHAVLAPLRGRVNPFLDTRFIDKAYGMGMQWYENSSLHRAIIAHARPALLPFFDAPLQTARTVQEWPARFAGGIGAVVSDTLDKLLPACDDVFDVEGVRTLCRETISRPSRAIYHLLRVVSFVEARRLLRFEAKSRLAAVRQFSLQAAVEGCEARLAVH